MMEWLTCRSHSASEVSTAPERSEGENYQSENVFFDRIDYNKIAEVTEWHTWRSQKPLPSRACGFDSHLRHFKFSSDEKGIEN